MHAYSIYNSNNDIRIKVSLILFCISVMLCTFSNIFLEYIQNHFIYEMMSINKFLEHWKWMNMSIDCISAFLMYGILYWLFDNFIWKWKIIIKYTKVPNFSGKWKGRLKSSYNEAKYFQMEVVIKQTWTRISIYSYFQEADSWSEFAHINSNHGKGPMLGFVYTNRANNVTWDITEHRGENELFLADYNNQKKCYTALKGDYFNNRGTHGNRGVIELTRD